MKKREARNQRARELALQLFGVGTGPQDDPLMFLMRMALLDDQGSRVAPARFDLSPTELDWWCEMSRKSPAMRELVEQIIQHEQMPIPETKEKILDWTAEIITESLSQTGHKER